MRQFLSALSDRVNIACATTLLLGAVFTTGRATASHSIGVSESELRAAYVFNFASLVEWPAHAMPPAGLQTPQQVLLCHIGQDDSGVPEALARLGGRKANARDVVFKRLQSVSELKGCHIAVIGELESSVIGKLGEALRGAAVVTIAMERDAVASSPEIAIRLAIENERMVFEVNNDYAKRAGLTFSSKLLRLARRSP